MYSIGFKNQHEGESKPCCRGGPEVVVVDMEDDLVMELEVKEDHY